MVGNNNFFNGGGFFSLQHSGGASHEAVDPEESADFLRKTEILSASAGFWKPLIQQYSLAAGLKASTKQVLSTARRVREFLQSSKVRLPEEITVESIEKFLAGLKAEGRAIKTLWNARSQISAFCRWCKRHGYMTVNPCREVELAQPEVAPPPTMAEANIEPLLLEADRRGLGLAVRLAVFAGLRVSEICRLAWADLDADAGTITIRKAKSRRFRVVAMHGQIADALEKTRHNGTRWAFPSRHTFPGGWEYRDRPMSPKTLGSHFTPLQQLFGEFTVLEGHRVGRKWHLLRHTFATRLAAYRVDKSKIRDWLGHSTMKMTDRYVHAARGYDSDIEVPTTAQEQSRPRRQRATRRLDKTDQAIILPFGRASFSDNATSS